MLKTIYGKTIGHPEQYLNFKTLKAKEIKNSLLGQHIKTFAIH